MSVDIDNRMYRVVKFMIAIIVMINILYFLFIARFITDGNPCFRETAALGEPYNYSQRYNIFLAKFRFFCNLC